MVLRDEFGGKNAHDICEMLCDFPGLASVKMLARQGRGLPDWEKLDGILSEPQNLESLQAEAQSDVFGVGCMLGCFRIAKCSWVLFGHKP